MGNSSLKRKKGPDSKYNRDLLTVKNQAEKGQHRESSTLETGRRRPERFVIMDAGPMKNFL